MYFISDLSQLVISRNTFPNKIDSCNAWGRIYVKFTKWVRGYNFNK